MKLRQLENWFHKVAWKTPRSRKAMLNVAKLVAGDDPGFSDSTFEIGLNSAEAENSFKLIFLPPFDARRENLESFDGNAGIIRALHFINREFQKKFNVSLAESLFSLESVNWKSGWEYDGRLGSVRKASFYAPWRGFDFLRRVAKTIGALTPRWARNLNSKNCDSLGVDFWPEGRSGIKIYRLCPPASQNILNAKRREIFERVSWIMPAREILFLDRLDHRGKGRGEPKIVLRLKHGIRASSLKRLGLDGLRPFLKRNAGLMRGQTIYYLSLSGRKLELYFRKTVAPWV